MSCLYLRGKSLPPSPTSHQTGFGLIELLVSISIVALVSSVVFVRQSSFNGAVLLRSQAYEIALQAREVQLYAVSAIGDGGDFRERYGLYFTTVSPNNTIYNVFRDSNDNNRYEVAEQFGFQGRLDRRFEIRAVRAEGGGTLSGSELVVLFERPNFDARFYDGTGAEVVADRVEVDIAIIGQSGTGAGVVRTLEISSTGQIAVQ
jgi:prepilin-type N-terminal cleavage/methylation domain-containing protein